MSPIDWRLKQNASYKAVTWPGIEGTWTQVTVQCKRFFWVKLNVWNKEICVESRELRSDFQMGFEPTTICTLKSRVLTTELLRTQVASRFCPAYCFSLSFHFLITTLGRRFIKKTTSQKISVTALLYTMRNPKFQSPQTVVFFAAINYDWWQCKKATVGGDLNSEYSACYLYRMCQPPRIGLHKGYLLM